jgi:hypothetical protein
MTTIMSTLLVLTICSGQRVGNDSGHLICSFAAHETSCMDSPKLSGDVHQMNPVKLKATRNQVLTALVSS